MARSFNDSTDRMDYTRTWSPQGVAFSWAGWVYLTQGAEFTYMWHVGQDDSNFGMGVCHRGDDAVGMPYFFRTGSSNLYRRGSSGDMASSAWTHLIVTHDGTMTDETTVHIYADGSEVSYGTSAAGSTEVSYAATNWSIGARDYDDSRNFGGYLAEVAIWNRVLSTGEITALGKGYSPQFFLANMKGYWSLVRDTLDRFNGDYGTLDGTAVVAHPPKVLYPAPPLFTVPAAVAADAMPMAMHYYRTRRA